MQCRVFQSLFVLGLFLIGVLHIKAQELPVAGYDTNRFNPLFIQSKDGVFRLNMGMYAQFRYNMNFRQNTPDSVDGFTRGFNLARTRMFFEGHITEKINYHFRININPGGNIELIVAYLQWNFGEKIKLRLGKQFMALGREDWILAQDLASIEFSAHDFTYAIGPSFGFQLMHTPSAYFRYFIGVGNGAYGGRREFPGPDDSDIALTGRFEYNVMGSDWDIWEDFLGRKGQSFGILIGLGVGHNERFDKESLSSNPKSASQGNIDLSISGNGFNFLAHTSFTYKVFEPDSLADFYAGGFYSTFGYWIGTHFFPYLRFDLVYRGNDPEALENYAAPGIGVSYYPFKWSNRIRFTLEYNILPATLNNTPVQPDGQLGLVESNFGGQQFIMFQAQFGF